MDAPVIERTGWRRNVFARRSSAVAPLHPAVPTLHGCRLAERAGTGACPYASQRLRIAACFHAPAFIGCHHCPEIRHCPKIGISGKSDSTVFYLRG